MTSVASIDPCLFVSCCGNSTHRASDGGYYFAIAHSFRSGPDKLYHSVIQDCSRLIAGLLLLCGPTAIGRFVISIVVDAVYRVFRRGFWPHIFIKFRETFVPPFANLNPATAVNWVFFTRWRVAPVFHMRPTSVFRRSLLPTRYHSMPSSGRRNLERFLTAATFRVACAKVGRLNNLLFPAIALAKPCCHPVDRFREALDDKITVSFTREVHYLAHIAIIRYLWPIVKRERKSMEVK